MSHRGPGERFLHLLIAVIIVLITVLMTLKGGTSGACASCKSQRRRCIKNCPLAPYFPAEQPKLFQNVHRLFGVRRIVKILELLDENQKPEAMKSIIFQSYVRDRSPVHGCLGVTQQLQYMIWMAEEELKAVNLQLQFYRSQQQNGQNQNHNHNHNNNQMIHELGSDNKPQEDVTSQLDLGMGLNVNNNHGNVATPFFSPLPVSETQQPQMSYTYSCSEVNNNGYSPPAYNTDSSKEILTDSNNVWGGQNRFLYNNNNGGVFSNQNESCHEMKSNNGVMAIQSQLGNLKMVSNHQQEEEEDPHEYDEIHQFLEMIDDRQSIADSKEAYASSSGESLKEQTGESGENELKSAATCFSLTSLN